MNRIVIIGGGISGLATAYFIRQTTRERGIPAEIVLFEAAERPGGTIRSLESDGFVLECGPNGFLDNKPETLALATDALGLSEEIILGREKSRQRFIFTRGRLVAVPEKPGAFFRSPLLSVRGRLRILGECFVPPVLGDGDLSVTEFGRRRLGAEFAERILDPMVSGIYAGDPGRMSLASSFPRIAELERDYGGLLRAMMKLEKEKKKAAGEKPAAGPSGPGGVINSFRRGLEEIIRAAAESLGPQTVRTGQRVAEMGMAEDGRIVLDIESDGSRDRVEADAVVMAVPAYEAARIVAGLDASMASVIGEIPYAGVAVVGLGYQKSDVGHDLNGYGFLIPHVEESFQLGTLWESSIFESRAPEGAVLLRSMVGGARRPERLALDDEELIRQLRAALEPLLGIRAEPVFTSVIRWAHAIPQYTVGHSGRLEEIETRRRSFPGLFITGNAYSGIGVNDCVKSATETAKEVVDHLASKPRPGS